MTLPVIQEAAHALCAPSAYDQWSKCPGSVAMQMNEPESRSTFADEGAAAHFLLSESFAAKTDPATFLTRQIAVRPEGARWLEPVDVVDGASIFTVDTDMATYLRIVQHSVYARRDEFLALGAKHVHLFFEQRLSIEEITGERGAKGTSDIVMIAEFDDHSIVEIDDLKYGMGVPVSAIDNGQLRIYALSVVHKHQLVHDFKHVIMRIHQPRLHDEPSEEELSLNALVEWGKSATQAAQLALRIVEDGSVTALEHLKAGEDQCRFCRAKARCPELNRVVHESVFGEFQALDDPQAAVANTPEGYAGSQAEFDALLPVLMGRVAMIEQWCKTIRATTEQRLLDGRAVVGWKLVEGRKGARKWIDVAATERTLLAQQCTPETIYVPRELRTPAQMEKALGKTSPVWKSVAELVKQEDGSPSVAPADDPRAPYIPAQVHDFDTYNGSDLV